MTQDAAPQTFFFDRFGLDTRALESTLGSALARRADFADLYFEFRTVQGLSLEEGSVKKTTHSVSQGVGVRVLAGEKTGYAYSDEVTVERLQVAAEHARQIASASGLGWDGVGFDEEDLVFTREWLRSRANTIEGGSSEIQLNIIAKQVLGLPDGNR